MERFINYLGGKELLGHMALAVAILIQHGFLRHKDRLWVTGTLAETTPDNAGEWLDYFDDLLFSHPEDILRTDLKTLTTSIA